MSAAEIARALNGKRVGDSYMCKCPCHPDRTASLSVTDKAGRVLVKCFAGCDQQSLISALDRLGLWQSRRSIWPPCAKQSDYDRARKAIEPDPGFEIELRTDAALRIWEKTTRAFGSPVELYLNQRAITLPIPESIRFARLRHPKGGFHACMVALVLDGKTGKPLGIHRTFLTDDGAKANVDPVKAMLGACRGGVVRLGPAVDDLLIGEGLESCLSAQQASGKSAWAALSTSGMRSLQLPDSVRTVTICADADAAGIAAARTAAATWKAQGRTVRIALPKAGFGDFNDELKARAA